MTHRTVVPRDVEQAARAIADATAEGSTLEFRGAGSKWSWGPAPETAAVRVSTVELNQVIRHNPNDLTISVGAGIRLTALQRLLAEYGQWLAIDPESETDGATLGGLLAAADAGPRRLRYGTMRDLTIGARFVLADGRVARTGSHVIKNVAGYDLAKLLYGSMGSLGMVAEVILRLHPLPAATAVAAAAGGPELAAVATTALLATGVEPSAIEWRARPDGTAGVAVLFEGASRGAGLAAMRAAAVMSEHLASPVTATGEDAGSLWQAQVLRREDVPGSSTVSFGCLPSRLPGVLGLAQVRARAAGVAIDLSASLGSGVGAATVIGRATDQVEFLRGMQQEVRAANGRLLLRERADEVDRQLTPGLTSTAVRELQRSIKKHLDPEARLAPGRSKDWT